MLQQSSRLLLTRIGFDQAASAACTCLQQQLQHFAQQPSHVSQQIRSKSTEAGPLGDAAVDAQQANSGWSWFTPSSTAASPSQATPSLASDTAAAAAAGAAAGDPVSPAVTAAAAAAAAAPATATDLLSQADLLIDVSTAATAATIAAAHGNVWFFGTTWFMDLMLWGHEFFGVPWWASLIATNALIRLFPGLPITWYQQKYSPMMGKLRKDTEQLKDLSQKIKKAKTASEYAAFAEDYQTAYQAYQTKYQGKKRYTFLVPVMGLAQAGLFISQFSAIMTLAQSKLPSMTYEGGMWFSDLTLPDPFMALPIICAAATLAQFNSKRFQDQVMAQNADTMTMMKPLMNFMAVVILVAGYFQPSAIALLWASNSMLMITQNSLLSNPGVRRLVGLPPMLTAAESSSSGSTESPYATLLAQLSGKKGQAKQAVPASQVKAPPPGAPVAVNYVSKRPNRGPKRHIKVV